ncbi:hypothetical protein CCACVL1_27208 [Corchorus capsularis]|uniref:Uncharacterized protein n=1 Tax=Corchorus capsularis TaxID=210143 RepID=A0A1R3GBT2_COCAP|nr:hypothetical protein CCACVL1_27208 [Corchorus capsularis]
MNKKSYWTGQFNWEPARSPVQIAYKYRIALEPCYVNIIITVIIVAAAVDVVVFTMIES